MGTYRHGNRTRVAGSRAQRLRPLSGSGHTYCCWKLIKVYARCGWKLMHRESWGLVKRALYGRAFSCGACSFLLTDVLVRGANTPCMWNDLNATVVHRVPFGVNVYYRPLYCKWNRTMLNYLRVKSTLNKLQFQFQQCFTEAPPSFSVTLNQNETKVMFHLIPGRIPYFMKLQMEQNNVLLKHHPVSMFHWTKMKRKSCFTEFPEEFRISWMN